ncbi:MAG: hypothetical protein AMXMBFR8_12030 [Nevskiales bacterium]
MRILYSYGKSGFEAERWREEIAAASDSEVTFIPFNHADFLPWLECQDSVGLDRLYQSGDARLHQLHDALTNAIEQSGADVLFVTNAPPYHPDFLRPLRIYKVLYSTDDPDATYKRTIPYIHAYDHLMYCAPGYSRDMDLGEKLRYAGARRADWLPLGVFDYEMAHPNCGPAVQRDIDIVYVGACYLQKLPILASIRRVFGRRARIHGWFRWTHNAYLVLRHGYAGWVRSVSFAERVMLYRRAKTGFNIHWNHDGLGNQRLYHLPANGVMQICDCPDLLPGIFLPEQEIVGYRTLEDLLAALRYYLANDGERERIAAAGQARVMRDYTIRRVTRRAADLIAQGMALRSGPA